MQKSLITFDTVRVMSDVDSDVASLVHLSVHPHSSGAVLTEGAQVAEQPAAVEPMSPLPAQRHPSC